MYKILIILGITFLATGCAIGPKTQAIDDAVTANHYTGINKDTDFSFSIPSEHNGLYSAVDQFDFTINNGIYQGHHASALIGKSHQTGKWQVIKMLVKKQDKWVELTKISN